MLFSSFLFFFCAGPEVCWIFPRDISSRHCWGHGPLTGFNEPVFGVFCAKSSFSTSRSEAVKTWLISIGVGRRHTLQLGIDNELAFNSSAFDWFEMLKFTCCCCVGHVLAAESWCDVLMTLRLWFDDGLVMINDVRPVDSSVFSWWAYPSIDSSMNVLWPGLDLPGQFLPIQKQPTLFSATTCFMPKTLTASLALGGM